MLVFPVLSTKAGDPAINWKTLKSKNFIIHYPQKYRKAAEKTKVLAEKAHQLLVPFMRWQPSSPTHIVVSSYTDQANGSATVYYRKTIRIFITYPSNNSTLADFDDWLWILLIHEYTHILNMDTKGKLPRLINAVFGQLWVPNSFLPTWIIESMAVYSETVFSSKGRNRSAIYDMYMRTDILSGRFLRLDQISGAPIPYPHGTIPYLYGSRFIWFLAKKFGDKNIGLYSHSYGKRNIPWGLNKSSHQTWGKSIEKLYKEFKTHLKLKYQYVKSRIIDRGVREGKNITKSGEYHFYPSFHPDKNNLLLFNGSDGHSPRSLKIATLNNKKKIEKVKTVFNPITAAGKGIWYNSGVYFHQLELHKKVYSFNDIFFLDLKTQNLKQITQGKRIYSPIPTKKGFYAVKSHGTRSDLVFLNKKGKFKKTILKNGEDVYIYTPALSPDKKYLTYSIWKKGKRKIKLLELTSGKTETLTSNSGMNTDPVWTPDQKYIIFSSDRTGIFNLYALELKTKQIFQITNLTGGAFNPSISADGKTIAYSGYNKKGYDIYIMDFKIDNCLEPLPESPRVKPLQFFSNYYGTGKTNDYKPWKYLLPVAWMFDYGYTQSSAFNLTLFGFDPVNHHYYDSNLTWSFLDDYYSFNFNYEYSRFKFPVYASFYAGNYQKENMWVNDQWQDYEWNYYKAEVSSTYPLITKMRRSLYAYLTGNIYRGIPENKRPVPRPDSTLPQYPKQLTKSSVKLGGYYYATKSSTYALDWESGLYASAYAQADFSSSTQTVYKFSAQSIYRRKLPFGKHWVLSFNLKAGSSVNSNSSEFVIGGTQFRMKDNFLPWEINYNNIHGFPNYNELGSHYYSSSIYLTFPLRWIDQGISTLPVYLRRISGKIFFDAGKTFNDELEFEVPLMAMGGEIKLSMLQGYQAKVNFILGFSRGFGEYGEWTWYSALSSPLPTSISNIFR